MIVCILWFQEGILGRGGELIDLERYIGVEIVVRLQFKRNQFVKERFEDKGGNREEGGQLMEWYF